MYARQQDTDTPNLNDGILDDLAIIEGTYVNPQPAQRKVHTLARAWAHMRGLTRNHKKTKKVQQR